MLQRAGLATLLTHRQEEGALLLGQKQELLWRGRYIKRGEQVSHCIALTSETSAGKESIQSQGGMDVYEFSITSRVAGERMHCFSIYRGNKNDY